MDRGVVGTEGNQDNDETRGLQGCGTAEDRTVGQRSAFGSHWSLAKEERDIGYFSSLTVKRTLYPRLPQANTQNYEA
jgi:hypothetical protein